MGDLQALRDELRSFARVVVAFSGGSDSSFLGWVATETLGSDQARCVTAVSPSLSPEDRADCRALAEQWRLRWTEVFTDELSDPAYRANDPARCFYCKAELMSKLVPLARAEGAKVLLGVNVDDLDDHRPGQRAALEGGAEFPLVDAGFTKDDVRAVSRQLGLRTWDKPAAACLASRLPYGTPVTFGALDSVAGAESALRRLGLSQVRVRHYGDLARIEVDRRELDRVMTERDAVVAELHRCGYRYVTLDLEGFRSGNLNAILRGGPT